MVRMKLKWLGGPLPLILTTGATYGRTPVEDTLAPHVHVTDRQDQEERQNLLEPAPSEIPQRHRPGIEEGDLDVEEQEDHRHQVELDRVALARIADGRHAAFVRGELFRRRILRAEQDGEPDHHRGEPYAQGDHDQYAKPAVHVRLNRKRTGRLPGHARGLSGALVKSFPNLFML